MHVGIPITSSRTPLLIQQAITAMSRSLRSDKHSTGLILANGGMLTHQYAICLSKQPRKDNKQYPSKNPLPKHYSEDKPPFAEFAEGDAAIEVC